GYEISSQSTALGIANFSQATRVLLRQLDKSTAGNLFVEFQTSFRALKIRPGDLIALTYLKENFIRTPLRVVKLSPSMNYQLVSILAQIHDDDWYSDNPAVLGGAGRQPWTQVQMPRPLIGLVPHTDSSKNFEYFDFSVTENIQAQTDGTATDILTIGFSQPTKPDANSPNLPLLSLSPQYETTGGTLAGGTNLYYAVSALDATSDEGALSFTVPAAVPAGTNTNTVSIVDLSFPSTAAAFNVYRGTTPQMLYRIATNVPLAQSYTDTGAPPQPIGPPDASFDHANFYYRFEYAGPFPATIFSSTTIGWSDMGAKALAYAGMVVRITEGIGRGQERSIATNDQTTLTVSPAWSVIPDATSIFVVAEGAWTFAAVSATSPVQFEILYQQGAVIEISGRGANVNNQEGVPELCPLTRQALGNGQSDAGIAGVPSFTLAVPGGGELTLSQIGFTDLTNTASISSGTLQIFYWDELNTPSTYALAAALDNQSTNITLTQTGSSAESAPQVNDVIQIGAELMTILSPGSVQNSYTVLRGSFGSSATTHEASDTALVLQTSVFIVPFAPNFFGNVASINFLHTMSLPDVRICAAQFFVTNAFGDSQSNQQAYTNQGDGGLRTLSGGQFSIQVSGYLATQQNVAPPLFVEASHAVRDLRASVSQAASGYTISVDVLQNGAEYCNLTIASGVTASDPVDGVALPPLQEGAAITVNITLEVIQSFQGSISPGRDLTVTIRL
ncbi:MAG: hypothetical protein JO097_12365, partial [Acidobacteriaceae bacterium]|nr:hypothetical protein [Acidobacteriaceae bacterium]